MQPLSSTPPPATRDPAIRAILFDCDGTLLLTSDLHFKAISQAVGRQGQQMTPDWYRARTGLGRRDLFAQFVKECGVGLDVRRLVDDSIDLTVEMAAEARENPLVSAIARMASGRLPIAVVTNSETRIAQAFLTKTALLPLFGELLACEDAARPKPAPDLYLRAAARLGVAPDRCLVLEDSDQGIEAARSAGKSWLDVRSPDWPQQGQRLLAWLAAL